MRLPSRLPLAAADIAAAGFAATLGVTSAPSYGAAGTPVSPLKTHSDSAGNTDATAATNLAHELGSESMGLYLDSVGVVHASVTTSAAFAKAKSAGATPELVSHSSADLARATTALKNTLNVPGTSWGTDPEANQLVVTADSTMTGTELKKVKDAVGKLGSLAHLERTPGKLTLHVSGGDAITGTDIHDANVTDTYSDGINVRIGSTKYMLTAGHCASAVSKWFTQKPS